MVSEKRIEANRRNAQRSTGPRSIDGRARSSMNALRHGITGQVSIMNEEDRVAHDKFVQELIAGLKPEGAVELQFASVIAEDFWRLQRIRAVENDIFALGNFSDAADIDVDHPEVHTSIAPKISSVSPSSSSASIAPSRKIANSSTSFRPKGNAGARRRSSTPVF